MKITFLGTSAATSYPLPFCQCAACDKAGRFGGKNLRKRSSLLINRDLLIDLGPDIMTAAFMHNISIIDIRYCLQTHSHSDHFDPSHLTTRAPEYAVENIPHLQLYASRATLEKMTEMLRTEGYINDLLDPQQRERLNISVHSVSYLQSFEADKYHITAFPTNHDKSVESLLYSITEGNNSVFYGTDTGIIPEETWKGFHGKNLRFDIVILDHTYGPGIDGGGHLNANQFIEHIQRMKDEKLLKSDARIFATHISHEGNPIHDELVEYGKKYGYEIAYDGLVLEL